MAAHRILCLLLVASSMGDEENLQLLPRAPPLTHLPTCDVFLAPSTIPGSVCMNINKKTNVILCALWVTTVQIFASVKLVCSCILKQCAYLILADCLAPSNSRLDFEQLVSEFLQDALSRKTK